MKNIFEYCVKVNWNEDKIARYAANLEMAYEELIDDVLSYVKKNKDERTYNDIIEKLNNNQVQENLELNIVNPILLDIYNVKTYKLWRNDEEKGIVLKNIYDLWIENKYNVEAIVGKLSISFERALGLLKIYVISYLKMTEKDWQRKINDIENMYNQDTPTVLSKLVCVYDSLLSANTLSEITLIIESSGHDTTYLRSHLHDYLIRYARDNYDECMALIVSKFKMYSENRKLKLKEERQKKREEVKKENEEKMLPMANKLVKLFVTSSCGSLDEFLSKVTFNSKLAPQKIFNKCLELISKYNIELFQEYNAKIKELDDNYYNANISELIGIIDLIINGIFENDYNRPFDIIDYFNNATLSFNEILKLRDLAFAKKDISSNGYRAITRFIANNKKGEFAVEKDITAIYNELEKVSVLRDGERVLVVVTDDIKDSLINYLKENNVPINYYTYHAALTRYKNGYLMLNEKTY